jgi:Inner membrane component of T3SS, cytoplasmic domain
MIWVEILSRHRDVAGRFRVNSPEISIGRGYDNDVIIDDPYVAAQHIRVFRDDAGQLVAEDLGSANGMYLDSSKSRSARVVVDGMQPIRIGHTYLRIREIGHVVERERLAGRGRGVVPILGALVLGLVLLGLYALNIWSSQTSEWHLSDYLIPSLLLVGAAAIWVGLWALLSRLFSSRSQFLRHLVVAEAGLLAFWAYSEFAQFSAFAVAWPGAFTYGYIASWLILAVMCFLHLREVGRTHVWTKGIAVAALFATAVAVQTLQRSEAFANSGRQSTVQVLLPPGMRMVPLRDEAAFLDDISKLKSTLDDDRAQVKSHGGLP